MADRYYVEVPITGEHASLAGSEAHHLAHVMRAQVGHEVLLFDGSGAEFQARIERLGRAQIDLVILARHEADHELSTQLVLGAALPKGDRRRWLVEKAVELGVARLVPLVTERSNLRDHEGKHDKLERAVIEASKQCGRNRLMQIEPSRKLSDFVADFATEDLKIFAHPVGSGPAAADGASASNLGVNLTELPHPRVVIAIGPEGGFSDSEVVLAEEHGWQTIDLGPRILRVETAALALASIVAWQLRER